MADDDWLRDTSMSREETLRRFLALKAREPTTGTMAIGETIIIGFCPGCNTLHRTSDCPDDNPPESACICCEAIHSTEALPA